MSAKIEPALRETYNAMLARVYSEPMYDGRGVYNLYTCDKCQNVQLTTYLDKGVTPFLIKCKCGDYARHTDDVPEQVAIMLMAQGIQLRKFVRPTLDQLSLFDERKRQHVLNGGLVFQDEIIYLLHNRNE